MNTFFAKEVFDEVIDAEKKQKQQLRLNALEARVRLAKTKRKQALEKMLQAKKNKEQADGNFHTACVEVEKRTNELCEAYENLLEGKKYQ